MKSTTQSGEARLAFDRGQKMEANRDENGAIAAYDQAIAIDPKYAIAYDARGYAKSQLGDRVGAMSDYTTALTLDPLDAEAFNHRGTAEELGKDLVHAVADYNEAIRLDPKLAPAYKGRGSACLFRQELDEAITDFTQAIQLAPTYALAFYGRGLAELEQANFDAAVDDFSEAIRLDPTYPNAYLNRGFTHFAHHRLPDALLDFNRSAALDSGAIEARFLAYLINPDNESKAADAEYLRQDIAADKFDPWSNELAKFILGKISKDDLVKEALAAPGDRQKEELCQAYFYSAAKAELAGDSALADKGYRQCVETGVTNLSDFIVATAKIGTEAAAVPSLPKPPAIWINGRIKRQDRFFLFTTDKPVEGDTMGHVVLLGMRPADRASMEVLFGNAAERNLTVRLYGRLLLLPMKIKDINGELPNIEFLAWKIHLPTDPDVIPDDREIMFHDLPKY